MSTTSQVAEVACLASGTTVIASYTMTTFDGCKNRNIVPHRYLVGGSAPENTPGSGGGDLKQSEVTEIVRQIHVLCILK